MRLLTFEDVKGLNISPHLSFEWVQEMLGKKGSAIVPPKISLHMDDDSFFNVMPSLLPEQGASGVKIITRKLTRSPALDSEVLVYDYETLNLRAVIDGNWLTAMRTGAVAAHSVITLAKQDFRVVGVMGLGNTGRATMEVLLSVVGERPLEIKVLRYKDQHESYIAKFKGENNDRYPNVTFTVVDDVDEVVRDSDVVISAVTYQEGDFTGVENYKPGCLVVAVHLRGFMNCDTAFDRIYCDDIPHVEGFKYFNSWPNVAEVADVVQGRDQGRRSDSERIIVYNVGLSMHDVNFAHKILELAEAEGIGQTASLDPPTDKIWI